MDISNTEIIKRYKENLMDTLPYIFPTLSDAELNRAIDYSINKRFKNSPCSVYNNYKEATFNTNLLKMTEYILSKRPIVTSQGCLFTRHGDLPNPLSQMIEEFAMTRNKFKKEMLKYPKGTEQYRKYNLLQLVAKIDTNAIYGCLGAQSSIFYNIFVASSITRIGQSIIAAAIMFFEATLANNAKFASMDEILSFIHNVKSEAGEHKYKDEEIIGRDISPEELFYKIIMSCGYSWYPSEDDCEVIWDICNRMEQPERNRVYMKNNIFDFFNVPYTSNLVINMLKKLDSPFLDPNHPPETIKEDIALFTDLIREYVAYKYQYTDKIDRVMSMIRETSVITDTDSTMITLDGWYKFILEKTFGVDMKIKHSSIDGAEVVEKDDINNLNTEDEYVQEYDFLNDEIIETKRMVEPFKVIPQDGLRFSIINILAHSLGILVNEYIKRLSDNYNMDGKFDPCLLSLKNEFLFKKVLLTNAKKNYISKQELQEGNLVPNNQDQSLEIKGLQIVKAGAPEKTTKELSRILYEDIVNAEELDQLKILNELAIVEKNIYTSINNGDTTYFKPQRIKSMTAYENPMRIQGIKGAVAYNEMIDETNPKINLEEPNAVLIIKTNINKKTVADCKMKREEPERYQAMVDLMNNEFYKGEITSIAIPFDSKVPEWIIEFIDYPSIINDNLGLFPCDAIGLDRLSTNSPYSGIIKI